MDNKKSKVKSQKSKVVNEEVELLKSQLVRTLADYDNLVKRVEREKSEIQKIISLRLILKLLTVLDGLESAQIHLKDQGLELALKELHKILKNQQVEKIEVMGKEFNIEQMGAYEFSALYPKERVQKEVAISIERMAPKVNIVYLFVRAGINALCFILSIILWTIIYLKRQKSRKALND